MTQQNRTRWTLLVLLVLTLARIPLALALSRLLPEASVAPQISYVASLMQSLLLFALPGWLLTPPRRAAEPEQCTGAGMYLLALAVAVLARGVATPLNAWWAGLLEAPASVLPQAEGPMGATLMVLAVAVVPAVAEEMLFRGALLTNLLRTGSRWQAAALTVLMFALLHGSPAGLPGHLIISLLLTLLMMHTGSLAVPIAVHMLYNLLALCWPDMGGLAPWIAGLLLALLTAWLLVKLPRGKTRRMPATEMLLCAAILLAMAAQYVA